MNRPFLVIPALVLAACQAAAPETKATLVAPTEAEARQYAEQFIEAVSKPNVARASMMIEWDALLERATAGAPASARFRNAFIRGAKRGTQLSMYVQQMAKLVEEGAKISLLRIRGDDDERRALLRVLLPNGGVTYNELLLTRDGAGYVRAADVYAYGTGEYISATIGRVYRSALAAEPNALERLAGKQNTSLETVKLYKEMSEKVLAHRHEDVVAIFRRMPPELQKDRNVLVAYVGASAYLDEAQHQLAIDALRRAHPNDASLDLMLIDGYFMKKRYDEALQAVDRIDRSLGGDPYLDVMRANMLLAKGDLDAAHRFASRAMEREPSLSEAQWMLDNIAEKRRSE